MLLSTAAVLVLGALPPALGKPFVPRSAMDGTRNEIASQWLTATETVLNFFAPDPGCGDKRAWVGVFPSDARVPFWAARAWEYVEATHGFEISTVKFNNAQLGAGDYKAAFLCDDDAREPWMVSETFKVDEMPKARHGECAHRASTYNTDWDFTSCDKVEGHLCFDCAFGHSCIACNDCRQQCEQQCRPADRD